MMVDTYFVDVMPGLDPGIHAPPQDIARAGEGTFSDGLDPPTQAGVAVDTQFRQHPITGAIFPS